MTTKTAAALPDGYALHYTPGGNISNHQVAVTFEGKVVGHLQWKGAREVWGGQRVPDDSEHGYHMESVLIQRPPQIVDLKVAADHRRKGLATAMYQEAKRIEPDLVHDDIVLPDGQAWMESLGSKVAWQQAQSRDHAETMRMLDKVRGAAKKLSLEEATALTQRILLDAGFPQAQYAEAIPHPKGYGTSSVAWDTGTSPATPLVALARDMQDEFTTIHECAHIIRNGPSYAGVQSDSVIAHDDQWFTTFARLLGWYATPLCYALFNRIFGETGRAGRVPSVDTGLDAQWASKTASWAPFQPPEHIQITSGGDAVPGGYNGYYVAYERATGKKMGYLDYQSAKEVEQSEFGTPVTTEYVTIAMVEVEPEYRRQGVATVLLNALKHDFPDAVIDPGMTTPDGTAWWSKVGGKRGDLPSLRFEHLPGHLIGDDGPEPTDMKIDTLVAYDGDRRVGHISWMTDGDWTKGAVDALGVEDDYRRRGIATELLRQARQIEPLVDPRNTPWFTDDGLAWVNTVASKTADRYEGDWLINGKPYSDGVWIEVEPEVWYRGADIQAGEIPSRLLVRREGDKWAWHAQVLTFIGAPHEDSGWQKPGSPKGTAKTLEDAKAKAEASLAKDHEFFRRYEERQRANLSRTFSSTRATGLTFTHKAVADAFGPAFGGYVDRFDAHLDGKEVGSLLVYKGRMPGSDGGGPQGAINYITVDEAYRRQGIGTALLEHARSVLPYPVYHHNPITDAGREFARAVGCKTASMGHYMIEWAWQEKLDRQAGGRMQHDLTKTRTMPLLLRLAEQVMADYGIPGTVVIERIGAHLNYSEADYDPVGQVATLHIGDDMRNKWTLLHEMAHVVMLGRGGDELVVLDNHGYHFKAMFSELLSRYGGVQVDLNSRPVQTATAAASGPMPEDIEFRHVTQPEVGTEGIEAYIGGGRMNIGGLYWVADPAKFEENDGYVLGEITWVEVNPFNRRQGIATEMLRRAREVEPKVHHSDILTGDGTSWSNRAASLRKTADEDQCPYDASDSLPDPEVRGGYVCEDGHHWHPDDPAAQAFHGDGPQRGILQATSALAPGLWWRVHDKTRPFTVEDASSTPLNPNFEEYGGPQKGFSAFDNPWHLWAYLATMGWIKNGWVLNDDVVSFTGKKRRDKGIDGEALVVPDLVTVNRMSWADFERQLVDTPRPESTGPVPERRGEDWRALGNLMVSHKDSSPVAAKLWAEALEWANKPFVPWYEREAART